MTAMLPTNWDRPIGQARAGGVLLGDALACMDGDARYTLKASDTHQMTWRQLCLTTGRCPSTWHYRVSRYEMSPLEALRTPAEPHQHVVMSCSDLCRRVGLSPKTFQRRRAEGMGFREALLTPSAGRTWQEWDDDDHAILDRYYPRSNTRRLADVLGRTLQSVKNRARRRGLSKECAA